jgi:hypothetical protein
VAAPGGIAAATAIGAVDIVDVTGGDRRRFAGHTGRVNCVAADGVFVVSGGADTFVCCWRLDGGEPARVPSFRGEILCVAVSAEFALAVAGTRDGAILWITPGRGAIARVVQLPDGEVPRRLMITHEWGFVVAHTQAVVGGLPRHSVAVYGVNGEKVRVRAVERPIAAWCCWSCARGFDHALIVDDAGCVFACEVFWLDFGEPIDVCAPAGSIDFLRDEGVYVIVGRDGSVRMKSIDGPCCQDGVIGAEDADVKG